jgi:hypothetical protein
VDLYNFAANTRRAILYGILGLIALLVLMLLYRFGVNLYLTLNPPPEPPPTAGFGKLPKLNLPSLTVEGSPTYLLETPTGELPTFNDRIEVVAMASVQPTLLGEEKARELAEDLDFGGQGSLSTDRQTLTFRDETDKRTLAVNVVTQNFVLSTDLGRIASLPLGRALSGPNAILASQSVLNSLGLLEFGFDTGNQTTTFKAVENNTASKAGSISEAHFTEVNFFRSLTEVASKSYPILPSDPKAGLIRVWMTSQLKPAILNTLSITYNAQQVEIDKTKSETYPLENVATAWESVKQGAGVAYVEINDQVNVISITDVSIAYFDDAKHQSYLQPIYVFSGVAKTAGGKEGEFYAYTPAISSKWINQ